MSPSECLSQFVTERLTAAAEEIFVVFQQTIAEYEKEIERQRRLLDVVLQPELKLRRIEIPQQCVFKEEEEEGLADQERNSSLGQEDPEPPQIKEEPEDPCDTPTPISEERDHSEPEPKVQHQLLSDSSHAAVSQEQREGKHEDWRSTQNAEPNLTETHHTSQSHSKNDPDTHTGEKSFRCGACGKAFDKNWKLNAHLRSHTGGKPYLCKTCGKRLSSSSALSSHLRIHTGEKPFLCKTCGKGFISSPALSSHLRIHEDNKQFLCQTCGKGFTAMTGLTTHMRTHTGERPYPCITCGKRFIDKSKLRRHTKTHTGERPHLCKTCGKGFIEPSKLKRHMRRHTVKKPLTCACGKCFKASNRYNKRTHTGEKAAALQDPLEKIPSESVIGNSDMNQHRQEAAPPRDLQEKTTSSSVKIESPQDNANWCEVIVFQDCGAGITHSDRFKVNLQEKIQ